MKGLQHLHLAYTRQYHLVAYSVLPSQFQLFLDKILNSKEDMKVTAIFYIPVCFIYHHLIYPVTVDSRINLLFKPIEDTQDSLLYQKLLMNSLLQIDLLHQDNGKYAWA